jgi:hypothetical protein
VLFLDIKALLQVMTTSGKPGSSRANRPFTPSELQELQDLAVREARRATGHLVSPSDLTAAHTKQAVNRLVKRATLLHMDIALLVPSAADRRTGYGERPLFLAPRPSVKVIDGQQVGIVYYGSHWDFARLLLDEVTPDPAADSTVRQWYRGVAAIFASEHLLAESRVHLTRARLLFPGDPEFLAASGRLHENYASEGIQTFLDTSLQGKEITSTIGSRRSNLRQAETYFRKAVDLRAGFAEARVHLGRLMGAQGRHEDAARELRNVAVSDADAVTHYYAWLFLGVEEQALARPDRARECFNNAAVLYPQAQSPYLALSQLARRTGDRPGALRAIQRVFALSTVAREHEDPWSTYLFASGTEAARKLSDVRAVLFLTPEER